MHQATGACAVQVAETHRTVRWSWFQTVSVGSGAAPDWCSEWNRSPQNRWNEEEKSNQKHDMCEAGEQDERNQQEAGEQKGGAEDTCDCDSESHSIPWSRAGVQEKYSHGRWPALHDWEWALGEREVERQLHVPCEPQFEGPQVAK